MKEFQIFYVSCSYFDKVKKSSKKINLKFPGIQTRKLFHRSKTSIAKYIFTKFLLRSFHETIL